MQSQFVQPSPIKQRIPTVFPLLLDLVTISSLWQNICVIAYKLIDNEHEFASAFNGHPTFRDCFICRGYILNF